uniref:Uncharacterized protein n=1 Tax=Lynx canadensis TaxID=61383 RepID=A0A667HYV1_LYNCA
ITPALRTSSGSSVFWGSIYLLTASTRMLNIRATAKMELPNAPTTSARRKPKVLFLCRFIRLALTPSQAMIMETKWERTAKASEARERELPMWAITSSITNRRTLTAHRRTNRKLLPEYRPMASELQEVKAKEARVIFLLSCPLVWNNKHPTSKHSPQIRQEKHSSCSEKIKHR